MIFKKYIYFGDFSPIFSESILRNLDLYSGNCMYFNCVCCILQLFFRVASLLSIGIDNRKVGADNRKALELDNGIFFIFQPDFNLEISPKNTTKHPVPEYRSTGQVNFVAQWPESSLTFWFKLDFLLPKNLISFEHFRVFS